MGFADIDPTVHKTLREEHQIPEDKLFSDAARALDVTKPDAITCSIPNPQRFPILLKALEMGTHILVDKPVVHTVEQLKTLLEVYEKAKVVFSVAENYRLFPQSRFIHDTISKGLLGKLGSISVRFAKNTRFMANKFYGKLEGWKAVGLEDVIHYVDLFRYFTGSNPTELSSWGWRHSWNYGEGYLAIQANLKFQNDTYASYYGTWDIPINLTPWEGEWLIELERGCILWNRIEGKVEAYDNHGKRIQLEPSDYGTTAPKQALESESQDTIDTLSENSMDLVFELFTKAVMKGTAVYCPLDDNEYTMAAALALERSSFTKNPVTFQELLEEEGLKSFMK